MPEGARNRRTTWPVPAQLPADLCDYRGRAREVAEAVEVLGRREPAPPTLCLVGFPGVGKSALAVHAAHLVRSSFPDGQLYADLGGCTPAPAAPAAVLAGFLRAFEVPLPGPAAHPAEWAALYRSTLADRCVLVVLDDARDEKQVRPLVPGTAGSAVVVTCRQSLAGLVATRQLRLGPLPYPEALALLSAVVGDRRIRAEPAAARQVVEACACLPLAITLAGRRLLDRPGWPLAALAARLGDPRGRVDELDGDEAGLRATLQPTYRRLSERGAQALRRLGDHPAADIEVASFAGRMGWLVPAAERALDELTALGLLSSPAPGRYHRSPLLELVACCSPSRMAGAVGSPASAAQP